MNVVEAVARLVEDRVLVVGSLPPSGRDLDLLVRPSEAQAVAAGLEALGFEGRGEVFARFSDCGADVVDLTAAATWNLPPAELESLFSRATPIESSGKVCRPAPEHALLILARRTMREGPRLAERRGERVAIELGEDPGAFQAATVRAPGWGARRSLAALERAFRDGRPLPAPVRRRAITEELGATRSRLRAWVGAWRAVLRRPRRGKLLTLSADDVAAAGRHAEHLVGTLDLLGFEAVVARPRPRGGAGAARLALAVARASWPQRLRGKLVVCDRHSPVPLPLSRPTWVGAVASDRRPEQVCAELARSAWAAIS